MARAQKIKPDKDAEGNHTKKSEMQTKTKYQEETKINNLKWLENWYKENCNGDREHTYGISIQTIDNPGWKITINLNETDFENLTLDFIGTDNSEDDWFKFGIKDQSYIGVG